MKQVTLTKAQQLSLADIRDRFAAKGRDESEATVFSLVFAAGLAQLEGSLPIAVKRRARSVSVPFVYDSATSEDAAASMAKCAASYRDACESFIRGKGYHGATSDEIQEALGLTHQNGSARVSELARDGRIIRTNRKRLTRQNRQAFVYVAPEFITKEK